MKRFNKFLALFLVVVMAMGLLPATATAAEANSKVVFEEDFEDYTSIVSGEEESPNQDRFVFDQYWQSGTGELAEGVGHDSTKSALLTSTTYKVSGPDWTSAQYGFGRFVIQVDTSKFEAKATYKISAWFKTSSTGLAKFTVQASGQSSQMNATNQSAYPLSSADGWVQKELQFVMPAGVTTKELRVVVGGDYPIATNDAKIWIDDVRIEKVKDAPDPYIAVEDSFETWTEIAAPHSAWYPNGSAKVEVSTEKAYDGTKSIKFSTPNQDEHHRAKLNYIVPKEVIDTMEDGAKYTLTAYFYSDGAKFKGNWEIKNKPYPWPTSDVTLTDGEWVKAEYTFTLNKNEMTSSDLTLVLGMAWGSAATSDGVMYIDSVSLVKVVDYDYSDLESELATGDARLMADVDAAGSDLVLKSGKTLNLFGNTLIVDSLSAMPGAKVIDTVGGGKLVVIDDNLTLQADNGYMPVKTEDGYIFVTVKDQHKPLVVEPNKLTYSTRPALEKVTSSTYLGNGAKDNGLSIIIRLTWTNTSNGTTTTMDVNCLDELVGEVYSGDNSFELIVTGVGSVENLQVATVICSDTGVVFVGEALPYNAQQ